MKTGRWFFLWFFFTGCVGLFVALTLAYVPWTASFINNWVRLALWPTIVFGMADLRKRGSKSYLSYFYLAGTSSCMES
jgi:hypothetical protein